MSQSTYVKTETTLIDKVASWECPCDKCEHYDRCKTERLSCQAYWLYMKFGNANYPPDTRIPSKDRYVNQFCRVV